MGTGEKPQDQPEPEAGGAKTKNELLLEQLDSYEREHGTFQPRITTHADLWVSPRSVDTSP